MPKAKTLEQYLEDISPKLKVKNYTYKGQKGMWQGCRTRIILNCPEHGDWDTATINRVKDGHTETFDIQYLPDIISFLEECNCQKFEEV